MRQFHNNTKYNYNLKQNTTSVPKKPCKKNKLSLICNSSMRDTPTRPSRKIRARESRISHFRGKKQDFDIQFFAFNIFSLGKANGALRQVIVFRSDTQHQVSNHGHQDSKQRAKSKSLIKKNTFDPHKLAPREAKHIIQTVLHQINTSELSFWH